MACICVTDHAEARVEVKVVSNRCVHVLSSSLIVEVLFLEMEPPAKRRIHRPCFQDSWKTGRPWLVYDMETKKMTCSWCATHFRGKVVSGGHERNAWITAGGAD